MRIYDEKIIEKLKRISVKGKSRQERMRAHAIVLSNKGKKSHEIAAVLGVTQRSVFHWFREYKNRGFDSLVQQKGRGRKAKLSKGKHLNIVKKHIEKYPHQPKKAFALTVSECNIEISYDTFKRFLKKHSI